MEKMKVFGKQRLDFPNKEGERIHGISLHCVSDYLPNENWEGQAYVKLWCPFGTPVNEQADKVLIGSRLLVDFDRKGKPVSFTVEK